jgi:hypothetical protein
LAAAPGAADDRSLAAMALAGFLMRALFPARRGMDQLVAITGVDQVWIYGRYYIALAVAVLAVWTLMVSSGC